MNLLSCASEGEFGSFFCNIWHTTFMLLSPFVIIKLMLNKNDVISECTCNLPQVLGCEEVSTKVQIPNLEMGKSHVHLPSCGS